MEKGRGWVVEIILVYQEKDTQCLYALQEQTPGFSIINYVLHTSMLNSSSLKIKKMTLKKILRLKKQQGSFSSLFASLAQLGEKGLLVS